MNKIDLNGRCAVVTGGAQGFGRAIAERFEVPDVFTDFEDLLDAGAIDAAVVATPNHLHEPHVLSAIAAKVHVLCERPLALTARGVERIIAAAARAERYVLVGNNHRFRNDVQMLDSFLRGGELGKMTALRAGAYHLRRPPEGWRHRCLHVGRDAGRLEEVELLAPTTKDRLRPPGWPLRRHGRGGGTSRDQVIAVAA